MKNIKKLISLLLLAGTMLTQVPVVGMVGDTISIIGKKLVTSTAVLTWFTTGFNHMVAFETFVSDNPGGGSWRGYQYHPLDLHRVSSLVDAVERDSYARLNILLKSGLCSQDSKNRALHIAINRRKIDMIKLLAQYGADGRSVVALYNSPWKAIEQACFSLEPEKVVIFLSVFNFTKQELQDALGLATIQPFTKKLIQHLLKPTFASAAKLYLEHNYKVSLLNQLEQRNVLFPDPNSSAKYLNMPKALVTKTMLMNEKETLEEMKQMLTQVIQKAQEERHEDVERAAGKLLTNLS